MTSVAAGDGVSIVIPAYNSASTLDETLASVHAQTHGNWEAIVVVDGGSTDGSVEIIYEYADRIAYWQSAPDEGQASAINAGPSASPSR